MNQETETDEIREIWGELVMGINETFEFGKITLPTITSPDLDIPEKEEFEALKIKARKDLITKIESQIQQIKGFQRILNKMMLINGISIFEAFYKDLIKIVLRRSGMAIKKSNKTIEYNKIFEYSNLESVLDYLIDKEILEISYKSVKEQFEIIKKKYGFSIDEIIKKKNYPVKKQFQLDLNRLAEIFATRNILLHNKGIVNEQYQKNASGTELKAGQLRPLNEKYVSSTLEYLLIFGTELYIYANEKYKKEKAI